MRQCIMISAAVFAASLSAYAQTTQRLSATKANDYGIIYTLPKTLIDVTVEAEIEIKQPGEFYKYAGKYLNISDPITEPSAGAVVRSVVIEGRGVADPDRRYVMTLKGGNAPYVIVGPDNIPLSVNTEKVFEKTVERPEPKAAEPTPLETAAARQVITEEMLQSHSSAKRAELAAEQIYALRQSRTDLITGQAEQMPPDGQAMQLVLDNIDAQEKALMAMFVGTTKRSTVVETVTFEPEGDVADVVVARVSPSKGIVPPTDLSGAPVRLSLSVVSQGELPVNDKGDRLPFPKGGVAYAIPGTADVSVSFDGETIGRARVDVAQLGVVYGMNPSNFTDKKAPVYLLFDPSTGAAVEVGPAVR